MDQPTKAAIFKRLHETGTFVIPNPWDTGSARLLQHLGFAALATTSAGCAFGLGRPDGAVSRDEALRNAADIAQAVTLPVSADLESGYGDEPEACAMTIAMAGRAGLVGGSIEDATGRADQPIYELGRAAARIEAAAEAARSLDFPLQLVARAENYLHGRLDLADTIKRLQAYQEAGADVLYAPGLRSADEIATLVRSVDRPVNVLMGLQAVRLSVAELAELGVRRISVGGALARAAIGALMGAAREMRDRGTFNFADEATPFGEINAIFAGWSQR